MKNSRKEWGESRSVPKRRGKRHGGLKREWRQGGNLKNAERKPTLKKGFSPL